MLYNVLQTTLNEYSKSLAQSFENEVYHPSKKHVHGRRRK